MEENKQASGGICAPSEFLTKPTTPDELHAWVLRFCGINVPRKPVCAGHDAPFEYLWHAFNEPSQDVIVWAPRGGGKTKLGAVATLLDLIFKPGCSIRILGGSLEQSMKMWEHLSEDVQRLCEEEDWSCELKANRLSASNGAIARVLTQSQKAVRGLRVQKLRCDEVELFDPRVWSAAQLTTKTRSRKGRDDDRVVGVVEVFSTLHRPWGLMRKIVDGAPERRTRVIKWCILDVLERCPDWRNCDSCLLLPECDRRAKSQCDGFFSIDDAIRIKSRVSAEVWDAEMLCRRPSTTDCVFPSFDPDLHVLDNVDHLSEYARSETWLGIDFGFAAPFVCLWIVKYPRDLVHVIDEYVQPGKIMCDHIAEIRQRLRGEVRMIACDPAGSATNEQTAKSNVRLLEESGYTVRKRGSIIQDGLEMIRARLKNGAGDRNLFIHSRCKNLIRALQSYRYSESRSSGENPFKDGEHDHLIDALRYFFVNQVSHKVETRSY
jgi:hypothetical protein